MIYIWPDSWTHMATHGCGAAALMSAGGADVGRTCRSGSVLKCLWMHKSELPEMPPEK